MTLYSRVVTKSEFRFKIDERTWFFYERERSKKTSCQFANTETSSEKFPREIIYEFSNPLSFEFYSNYFFNCCNKEKEEEEKKDERL